MVNCIFDEEELNVINIALKSLYSSKNLDIVKDIIDNESMDPTSQALTDEETRMELSRIRGMIKGFMRVAQQQKHGSN